MCMQWGIILRDMHSFYDWRAYLERAEIGYPKQKKIVDTVPFFNGNYDFSYLYGGKKFYEERSLTFIFGFKERNRILLLDKVNRFVNWLEQDCGKKKLIYTKTPEYHFSAELSEVVVEYPISSVAKITATFTAYPFRIPNDPNSVLSEVI